MRGEEVQDPKPFLRDVVLMLAEVGLLAVVGGSLCMPGKSQFTRGGYLWVGGGSHFMAGDGNHFGGIETIVDGNLILAYTLGSLRKLFSSLVGLGSSSSSYPGSSCSSSCFLSVPLFFFFVFCSLFFFFFVISLQDMCCFFLRYVWRYFRD